MRRGVGPLRVAQLHRPARGPRFPKGPTAGGAVSYSAVQLLRGPRTARGGPGWARGRRRLAEHADRCRSCGVADGVVHHLDSCRRTMSYFRRTTSYNTDVARDVVRGARSTSYPCDIVRGARAKLYVRHRISMSYVRQVRHRNIRCRMCIRYRRSDVRHRMFSSYATSYVLTCISYFLAYNIAYNITYDIVYDIACDVHSIGFGAGFRGFKLHAQLRRHRSLQLCMAMSSFRHRPPHQWQAVPRHCRRSRQRRQGQEPQRRQGQQIPPPLHPQTW
jgi:hypothetical protein